MLILIAPDLRVAEVADPALYANRRNLLARL